jgi:ABC-type dipeptide/oligopeptide/nickel transport system permease component
MMKNELGRYVGARLIWAASTVLGILIINFVVVRLVPGDPVQAIIGDFPAPPDYIELVRHQLGLDQSLPTQLWLYLLNLTKGNLGYSFVNRLPVLGLILGRSLNTLLLVLPALVLSAVLGILFAMLAATRAGTIFDTLLTVVTLFGFSVPIFWLGQILIVVFAIRLGWLPAQGFRSLRESYSGLAGVLDVAKHMVLPMFGIAIFHLAIVARVARTSILQAMQQHFVLNARSKGLSRHRVLWRHVLPNALIPIVTVIGYNFGHSLTGAILTESVFAWPGLGNLFVTSITSRDYPVLEGIFLLTGFMVVISNLITDLLYLVIDPRVLQHGRADA